MYALFFYLRPVNHILKMSHPSQDERDRIAFIANAPQNVASLAHPDAVLRVPANYDTLTPTQDDATTRHPLDDFAGVTRRHRRHHPADSAAGPFTAKRSRAMGQNAFDDVRAEEARVRDAQPPKKSSTPGPERMLMGAVFALVCLFIWQGRARVV